MSDKYKDKVICRGSWALGSACGSCQKCIDTMPEVYKKPPTANSEMIRFSDALKEANQTIKSLQSEIAALKPQWISVDGAESDIEVEGYYWWNPRSSENRKEQNWQVVYCNPKNTDMINRQGIFVGPLPPPPEDNQ